MPVPILAALPWVLGGLGVGVGAGAIATSAANEAAEEAFRPQGGGGNLLGSVSTLAVTGAVIGGAIYFLRRGR